MYEHPKLTAFTKTLEALFHEVDDFLEDEWGGAFSPHPARPKRGATANPEMDGLFELAPDFSPGLGSKEGRGYLVSLRTATLEKLSRAETEYLMQEAASLVAAKLPVFFPGRDLRVVRDGKRFKIVGDLSLGEA